MALEKINLLELLKNNPQWGPPFGEDINCQAFYELMQNYLFAGYTPTQVADQPETVRAYELVMDFVREWAKHRKGGR